MAFLWDMTHRRTLRFQYHIILIENGNEIEKVPRRRKMHGGRIKLKSPNTLIRTHSSLAQTPSTSSLSPTHLCYVTNECFLYRTQTFSKWVMMRNILRYAIAVCLKSYIYSLLGDFHSRFSNQTALICPVLSPFLSSFLFCSSFRDFRASFFSKRWSLRRRLQTHTSAAPTCNIINAWVCVCVRAAYVLGGQRFEGSGTVSVLV